MKFYTNRPDDRVLTPLHRRLFTFYYKLYIKHINQYPDKNERYYKGLSYQGGNVYGYFFWDNVKQNCLDITLSTEIMPKPDRTANRYPRITILFHKTLKHTRFSSTYLHLKSMYPKLGLLRVCFRGLR